MCLVFGLGPYVVYVSLRFLYAYGMSDIDLYSGLKFPLKPQALFEPKALKVLWVPWLAAKMRCVKFQSSFLPSDVPCVLIRFALRCPCGLHVLKFQVNSEVYVYSIGVHLSNFTLMFCVLYLLCFSLESCTETIFTDV